MNDLSVIFGSLTDGSMGFMDLFALLDFPTVLILSLALFANAIYGYRLFKYSLALSGAVSCGIIVYSLLLLSEVNIPVLNLINLPSVAGILATFIGGAIMLILHKLTIFVSGAGAGYFLGQWLILALRVKMPDVAILQNDTTLLVGSIVVGVLCGILFLALFKLIYITVTSIGGMTAVGALVGSIIMPTPNIIAIIITSILGFVAGIFAAMKQFRDSERA